MMTFDNTANTPVWFAADDRVDEHARFLFQLYRHPTKPVTAAYSAFGVVAGVEMVEAIGNLRAVIPMDVDSLVVARSSFTQEMLALAERVKRHETSAELDQFDALIADALVVNQADNTPVKDWARKLASSVFGR